MDGALIGGDFRHDSTTAPLSDRVLPLFSLKGRTAIVTGAGAGIGLGVAQALAEAGANVAIWYNSNKQAVEQAESIVKTYGIKCKSRHLLYIQGLKEGRIRSRWEIDISLERIIDGRSPQAKHTKST